MKQIFILTLLLIGFTAQAQKKKVAVVAFFADKVIDLSEVDASADFIAKNTGLSEDPNFDLREPLQNFYDQFFNNYVQKFDFELVDPEKVLNAQEFQDYKTMFESNQIKSANSEISSLNEQSEYISIEGYKIIPNKASRNEIDRMKPVIEALGVDAIMIVRLYYRFNKTGIGKFGYYSIQASVNVDLFSKNNKSIFQFNEFAGSKKKAVMVGGIPVMTPDKILPMCKDATEELIEDMNKKIVRLAKKANKKLK